MTTFDTKTFRFKQTSGRTVQIYNHSGKFVGKIDLKNKVLDFSSSANSRFNYDEITEITVTSLNAGWL